MHKKVTIVGAGHVGATLAQRVAESGQADVVLVDIVEGLPQGMALDMQESAPILGINTRVVGSNGYEETARSDIAVITAGVPRKPGMTRDDLLKTNQKIVTSVTEQLAKHSPNTIIIVISNPLDAMAQLAKHVSGFPRQRVVGMAGVLDSARFRSFLAIELAVSVEDVQAFVLGSHGDSMVPLVDNTTVGGVPVAELIPRKQLDAIIQRTREGGAEIVNYLKTGSAFYAPSAAGAQMVDAILMDKKRILPCSAYLDGEYGINGLFVGVPVKLGAAGVEQIIEVKLTRDERAGLDRCADEVRQLVDLMELS